MPSKNNEQWLNDTLGPAIERFPERQRDFRTDSEITIEPLYGPDNQAGQGTDFI